MVGERDPEIERHREGEREREGNRGGVGGGALGLESELIQ
jgi:hypothetical protein